MTAPNLSIIGAPPGPIPMSNICDWVFSQPFHKDNEMLRGASSPETKAHHIPSITPEKTLFASTVTGTTLTWERTRSDALRVAAGLQALGPKPDLSPNAVLSPIVMIHLPNCPQYAPLLYGVFASGLTATLVNPNLTSFELDWVLRNSRPAVIVTSQASLPVMKILVARLGDREMQKNLLENKGIFAVDLASDTYASAKESNEKPSFSDWKYLLQSGSLDKPATISPQQCHSRAAVILWSSGTSGKSKGVLLSHRNCISSLVALWHLQKDFNGEERWLGFVPFFHVFGLANVLLLAPCIGATVYTMPKFDPQMLVSLTQKLRITFLHTAPPVVLLLAKSPLLDGADFTRVRGAVSGGAPLGNDIIEQVYKRLGIIVNMGYGMSEAGTISHSAAYDWESLQVQVGSVGAPTYGVEMKLIARDGSGKVMERGQEGEILTRSGAVMLGYLNNEIETKETLDEDGWLHSGDVGVIDQHGNLRITDRIKELIKVKGFQVSPSDLDAILCASPLVADAAVTSVYDEEIASELPRAYIVPSDAQVHACCKPDAKVTAPELEKLAAEIKSWTEDRMANYKWLRGNVVFVQQIPKNPSGKILRRLLKDTKGVEVCIYPKKAHETISKL